MNSPSFSVPPGPREPDFVGLQHSSTHQPAPPFWRDRSMSDKWAAKPPVSQSRPYFSPDPSPLDEEFRSMRNDNSTYDSKELPSSIAYHPRGFPYRPPPRPPIFNGRPPAGPIVSNNIYFPNTQQRAPPFWQHTRAETNENDPWFNPVMLPQQQKPKKPKNQKKVEGKQPTFLTKLFGILDQPEYHHIIRWDETGEAIIIENPEELADKILPVVYRQSRFASFSRQLNIYGFNRKLSLRHVERGVCDPDASTWSHPFLKKHSSKAEILAFKRRVPPRPTQAQKRRMSMQEDGLSPTSSEHSVEFYSPPDAYQHHLLPDVDEEKPVIFSHPREPFLSQPMLQQPSFHAPPPDYYAYEQKSPAVVEFDYSTPLEHTRGFMNASDELPRNLFKIEPSTFFNSSRNTPSVDVAPQSAPANTSSFPIPIKITQQHARTRSVQGEPPSAMLYSPSSPYNMTSWLSGDIPGPQAQNQLKREIAHSPTSLPQTQLKGYRHHDQTSLETDQSPTWLPTKSYTGIGASPQSLPSEFHSPHGLPQMQYHSPSSGYQNNTNSLSLNTQTFSALSPDSPSTISLGIYQPGYAFPSDTLSPPDHSAISPPQAYQAYQGSTSLPKPSNIAQSRQERRATISSNPYSPRSRNNALSSTLGVVNIRTIASRRGSEAGISGLGLNLTENIVNYQDRQRDDHEALPSASIKLEDSHPFEGLLGEM
ncbi:uncharacterized protein L201_004773 [Kwoniella dendrophila CBS 6074]|uniref:HSF-type DNA-binding domain-containing protein n=1 Tax=Kwoniella dendrophila CBS 6074 TaxID=1295534 RepID=A0AAX4JWL4_9TREE